MAEKGDPSGGAMAKKKKKKVREIEESVEEYVGGEKEEIGEELEEEHDTEY